MAKKASKKASKKAAGQPAVKKQIDSYAHKDQKRANNPPVGLVTPDTEPLETAKKTYEYDPHLDPQLVWAGKAERTSFAVPTVSLHVHERIDPKSIIAAVRTNGDRAKPNSPRKQLSLFEEPAEYLPLRDALDFYKHPHGWTNRLVAGDSLLVMNSLLEKEGMAGKVQMIYIDPPYGIRYGSNFQPFVNRRDVKDGKDEDLTQEPETLKAFRDTWELGIHSYLTYLRDRLLLARELLHESGSVFVQISDENLHHVRELMDEVFGVANCCSVISFKKTGGLDSKGLSSIVDYVLWYARDRNVMKYRQLYLDRSDTVGSSSAFRYYFDASGERRSLGVNEDATFSRDVRCFQSVSLNSQGYSPQTSVPYEFQNKTYVPPPNRHWTTAPDGLDRLAMAKRIFVVGSNLRYASYLDDYPVVPISNVWIDTGAGSFLEPQQYVVQTVTKTVQRCLLMTTDPGDLVLDPTCGSGAFLGSRSTHTRTACALRVTGQPAPGRRK